MKNNKENNHETAEQPDIKIPFQKTYTVTEALENDSITLTDKGTWQQMASKTMLFSEMAWF